jgi:hypothetical protein
MAQNIKLPKKEGRSQPTRDVEEMFNKKIDEYSINDPEETDEEFLNYIKEDNGL